MSETAELRGNKLEIIAPQKSENLTSVEQVRRKVEMALTHFGKRPSNNLHQDQIKSRINNTPTETLMEEIRLARKEKIIKDNIAPFIGKLSTNPKEVKEGVSQESLTNKCEALSEELQRCLKLVGVDSTIRGNNLHNYLTTFEGKEKVSIDASIGQYFKGHNHIFVGTREQLKELVLKYALYRKLSRLPLDRGEGIRIPPEEAEDFFQKYWQK